MTRKSWPCLVMICCVASLFTGCSKYELLSKQALQEKINEAVANKEAAIRQEILEELNRNSLRKKAQTNRVAVVEDTQEEIPDSNLRKTRWGMTAKEVVSAEGSNYLKRAKNAIIYKISTVRLPSVIKYMFEEDTLVKADIYFSDPRLGRVLPRKSQEAVESDYWRVNELLSHKYGTVRVETNTVSQIETMEREKERLRDLRQEYERLKGDLEKEKRRKRKDLEREYKDWKNRDEVVENRLEVYAFEKRLREYTDILTKVARKIEDIQSQIREEKWREKDGKLPKTVEAHWYHPGAYDVTQTMSVSSKGIFHWVHYNGYVSDYVSAIPSDL